MSEICREYTVKEEIEMLDIDDIVKQRILSKLKRTSKTKLLTYSSLAEAAHDFWVKRKCGKDYRIVVLEKVKVERTFDYYETKKFI